MFNQPEQQLKVGQWLADGDTQANPIPAFGQWWNILQFTNNQKVGRATVAPLKFYTNIPSSKISGDLVGKPLEFGWE